MKIELITSSRPSIEIAAEKKFNSSSSSRARSKSPTMNTSTFRSNSSFSSSQKPSTSSTTKIFLNTPTQIQGMPKDTLSNRFKSIPDNKEAWTSLHMRDPKKSDVSSKINVDASIILQVLFNKKQNTNSRPVTFTVKL